MRDMPILSRWLAHFQRTGKPAGIVRTARGYSVWREGAAVSGSGNMPAYRVNPPQGVLIKSVHGFEAAWPAPAEREKGGLQDGENISSGLKAAG